MDTCTLTIKSSRVLLIISEVGYSESRVYMFLKRTRSICESNEVVLITFTSPHYQVPENIEVFQEVPYFERIFIL